MGIKKKIDRAYLSSDIHQGHSCKLKTLTCDTLTKIKRSGKYKCTNDLSATEEKAELWLSIANKSYEEKTHLKWHSDS